MTDSSERSPQEVLGATAKQRLELWTDKACLLPLLGVPLAWLISYVLYHWLVRCGAESLTDCREKGTLVPLRNALEQVNFGSDSAVRAVQDAAARFAWHPSLVAFIIVALGAVGVCWYLIHRSLQDSVKRFGAGQWNIAIGLGALGVALFGWTIFPQWILRTEVLSPILDQALGEGNATSASVENVERLFQTLAFLASCFVVGAASASLLTSSTDRGIAEYDTRHLGEQWRRLAFTLYVGASLLVTAVLHQTALFGWNAAFAKVLTASEDPSVQIRIAELDAARTQLAVVQARLNADTLIAGIAPTGESRVLRDRRMHEVYRSAFRIDSLTHSLTQDTLISRVGLRRASALMTQTAELIGIAIIRGGGLVYTILLAMTYLPAALVLMERAREVSQVVLNDRSDTEASRAQWRADQGIGFSLSNQWAKFAAVLAPLLASGGAAYFFNLVQ